MNIATRLKLGGLFAAVLVSVMCAVLVSTTQQVRRELAGNEIAVEVLKGITAVRYLTMEYVLRHEERAQAQWRLRHASLSKLLSSTTEFVGTEDQPIVDELRKTIITVADLFDQLVANRHESQTNSQNRAVLEELEARLNGQVLNKVQAMITGSLRLLDQSRDGVRDAQQRAVAAATTFGVIVLLVIATTLFFALRSVAGPLARLRDGIAIVGGGNLDFRLGAIARDEIGELSRAFDGMTEKLKGTTVSRDELVRANEVLQVEIVERKRTEGALRESQDRVLAILDTALDAIITMDHEGRILDFNPTAERVFGYRKGDVVGRQMADLVIPPSLRERHRRGLAHYLATGEGPVLDKRIEVTAMRADGAEFPIELSITRVGLADPPTFTGFVRDITTRKHGEKERDQLMEQLHTLNAALEERVKARTAELSATLKEREVLLQEIHHRVKNNLQVISSLINIQMRKLDNGASRDALQECQTRVQAIALIHEKLYQSRDYSHVPFAEYTRSLVATVFHATGVCQSTAELEVEIGDNVVLAVDKAIPCGLILNELITNALKHAFPDERRGMIRVELEQSREGQIRMAVKDNGVGLPAGLDIAHSVTLGLQLVCTLAEQLNAQLKIKQERPGTSFHLSFRV